MIAIQMNWIKILLSSLLLSFAVANNIFTQTRDEAPVPANINVGVYYYPWHAGDFHRNAGYIREVLEPRGRPQLGEYDDRSPWVISQHLAWSRQANVNTWICSWWGPFSREDNTIRSNILTNSDLGDHKIALFYESTGRIFENENWSVQRVQGDMSHICLNYFNNKNYLRIDGKPVLAMYLTRLLDTQRPRGVSVLEETTRIMRETARAVCGTEIYIIGDQVWRGAPSSSANYEAFNHLDAVTNYDVYGNVGGAPYAGGDRIRNFYERQQTEWKAAANSRGVAYIPAASPGYNDRNVRLERNNMALSRRLTEYDKEGSLFEEELKQARYLVDDRADRLLFVNSFNEWHEETQIEPTIGEGTNLPLLYTNGVYYEGYGDLYLNILRSTTCSGATCESPPTRAPIQTPIFRPTAAQTVPVPVAPPTSAPIPTPVAAPTRRPISWPVAAPTPTPFSVPVAVPENGAVGASCQSNSDCRAENFCDGYIQKTCAAKFGSGNFCTSDSVCASGACDGFWIFRRCR